MIRKIVFCGIAFLFISIVLIYIYKSMKINNLPREIEEIAYNVNKDYGYTVYIEEDYKYVPYLVLTNDYDDYVLLLRKNVLDEPRIYNENVIDGGYYDGSNIDRYLNEEFIEYLSPNIQDKIVNSKIQITDKSSLGVAGTEKLTINRKLFLLSYGELGLSEYAVVAIEGQKLKFFNNANSRIAYSESGEAHGWWLRTSYNMYDTTAVFVGDDATISEASVDYVMGIRPAFCIKRTTEIMERDDIVTGQTVYVLK